MHRPLVAFIRVNTLILAGLCATYMWISGRLTATMAAVFASPAFNLGDIRVSGTLAAVRGAFARRAACPAIQHLDPSATGRSRRRRVACLRAESFCSRLGQREVPEPRSRIAR